MSKRSPATSSTKPASIFKYEPYTLRAIENLKSLSLYFGSPNAFNDPFDCGFFPGTKPLTYGEANQVVAKYRRNYGPADDMVKELEALKPPQLREKLNRIGKGIVGEKFEEFRSKRGVTCFSACNDNLLMWSHYGGLHHGFCLEFSSKREPFSKLRPVIYAESIPEIDLRRLMLDEDAEHLIDLFHTKSKDWSYEEEWRIIHMTVGTEFTYHPDDLVGVYFGARATEQFEDMLCLILHEQCRNVKLYRGVQSKTEFKIDFRAYTYCPTSKATSLGKA